MTDVPQSPVARFGVKALGSPLDYGYVDEQGQLQKVVFHPRVGLAFEEVLEFQTMRQALMRELRAAAKKLQEDVDQIDKDLDPTERDRQVEEMMKAYEPGERERFHQNIETALFLVVEEDREALRGVMRKYGHPNDVSEVVVYLRDLVVTKTSQAVEAVAGVDPTLPPPQPD